MRENKEHEMKNFAQASLVSAIVVLSALLCVLNIVSGWELWTLPILVIASVIACFIHVRQSMSASTRVHIYAAILLIELFYYCVNIYMIFDSPVVIIMVMILFAMTQEHILVWLALLTGFAGMILHLFQVGWTTGLDLSFASILRTVLHITLVIIAGALVVNIEKTVRGTRESYEEQIQSLIEQNKSANNFLANVSHEIRTPINAVVGLTGVCMEKSENPEVKESLASVVLAGQKISEQINDILDYSEIDMERLAVNTEDYRIDSVLKDIIRKIEPYKKEELELVINVAVDVPAVLHSDVNKIKGILWHLILNGLKYTDEGGVYVHISSVKCDYGINLIIEVSDTGIGMTEEEIGNVFDRFYQADSEVTRKAGGLGLGLSITAGFVRALGGFITLDSKKKVGTRVHVSLPQRVVDGSECMKLIYRENLVIGSFLDFNKYEHPQVREYYNEMIRDVVRDLRVQLHRADDVDNLKQISKKVKMTHLFLGEDEYKRDPKFMEELAKNTVVVVVADKDFSLPEGSAIRLLRKPFFGFPILEVLNIRVDELIKGEKRAVFPGVRALVVDDEPLNLTVATGILQRYQMRVTTVASGAEAVEICERSTFDIIFMDHMMPGMDGVQTMKRIRLSSNPACKDIPVVALTANATSTAREMFAAEGFSGFVSKPIELVELERVMWTVLPKNRALYEDVKKPDIPETRNAEEKAKGEEPTLTFGKLPEDAQKTNEEFEEILKKAGINPSIGRSYVQNDDTFYKTLLQEFHNDAEKKLSRINECYEKEDYKNYEILVHAVKSTAKMIGAEELSDRALALEQAADEADADFLRENHEDMIRDLIVVAEAAGRAVSGNGAADDDDRDVIVFSPDDDKTDDDEVFAFTPDEEDDDDDDEVFVFEPTSEGGDAS